MFFFWLLLVSDIALDIIMLRDSVGSLLSFIKVNTLICYRYNFSMDYID